MNSYTDKSQFVEDAQFILDNSDLLIKSDCMIVDDVLYERLDEDKDHEYRFFFSCDDYDYLENLEMSDRLDTLYAMRTIEQR